MQLASITQHAVKPQVRKAAQESLEMVRQLSKEIRTVSYLLHPPLLDENGLSGAIQWYIQGLVERSGLKIELLIPKDFGRLPGRRGSRDFSHRAGMPDEYSSPFWQRDGDDPAFE